MSDGEDAVTNEPEAAGPTFDIPGDRQYSMIRDVPWGQSADYYAELIASFTLFAEQRDRGFNGNNAKQAEQPTKGQAAPQQRRRSSMTGNVTTVEAQSLARLRRGRCRATLRSVPGTAKTADSRIISVGLTTPSARRQQ